MYLSANIFVGGFLAYLVFQLGVYLRRRSIARRHGCKSPPKYPNRDPVFGIDSFMLRRQLVKEFRSLPQIHEWHQRFGRTYTSIFLGQNRIHTTDPANLHAMFGGKDWGLGPSRLRGFAPFCGEAFLSADGASWERSRHLINPTFHKSIIGDLLPYQELVDHVMRKLPNDGETVDLQPILQTLFIDSAGQFILGRDLGAVTGNEPFSTPISAQEFLKTFHDVLKGVGLRVVTGRFGFLLPRKQWQKSIDKVHGYIDYHITKILGQDDGKAASAGEEDRSTLSKRSLLVGVSERTQDKVEIRNQILQGMLAAHDTTVYLTSNTLWFLARNEDSWKQVRKEALQLQASAGFKYDALRAAPYVNKCLKESIRIYPVLPSNGRFAFVDTVLPRGGGPDGRSPVFVPAGTTTETNFYSVHRDPNVFGDNVEDFDPDRWDTINPTQWEYMPFGGGPRMCAGRFKAQAEAACFIMTLAVNYERLENRDDKPWQGLPKLTMMNVNGCKVGLIRPEP